MPQRKGRSDPSRIYESSSLTVTTYVTSPRTKLDTLAISVNVPFRT